MSILRICGLLLALLAGQLHAAALTDVRGVSFSMDRPPQRIISLAPHLTELLFSIGAGRRVIGAIEHSDYPEAARSIPRVGDASRIDMERILSLRADLVVAWQSGNTAADINKLEKLGIPVYVTETHRLPDVADLLLDLGRLTGRMTKARSLQAEYLERLKGLAQRYSDARPVTVFYQIWQRPLMTISGAHIISDAIRLCGGRNVFADLNAVAPTVDLESLAVAQPEVIIANTAATGDDNEVREYWASWPSLAAVKHDNVYTLPSSSMARSSLRIIDGVEELCQILEEVRKKDGAGK